MTQIETWRSQAAATLAFLVPKIIGNAPTANDGLVDDLVRALNNLPARPDTRQPTLASFLLRIYQLGEFVPQLHFKHQYQKSSMSKVVFMTVRSMI